MFTRTVKSTLALCVIAVRGLTACSSSPTTSGLRTQRLPAGSLRIGQRVVLDGHLLVVSSVRFEGAGGGVVSVEFAVHTRRSTFAPGEVLDVALSAAA